jgi:hypothetical protein
VGDAWTARMPRGARHPAAAAAWPGLPRGSPFGRQPKRKVGDDAPGVIAPLADAGGGPTCQRACAAGVGEQRGRGWLGRHWAESEAGPEVRLRPVCNSVACKFSLGLKIDSNLNSNPNLNSPN